jgi:alpha-L-fucosidase
MLRISYGGNLLVNVGPTHDGRIPIVFQERLTQLGRWMSTNGEAIYATKPFAVQKDPRTTSAWYTQSKTTPNRLYCLFTEWPTDNQLRLSIIQHVSNNSVVEILTESGLDRLKFIIDSDRVRVQLNPMVLLSNRWAWVIRITN